MRSMEKEKMTELRLIFISRNWVDGFGVGFALKSMFLFIVVFTTVCACVDVV